MSTVRPCTLNCAIGAAGAAESGFAAGLAVAAAAGVGAGGPVASGAGGAEVHSQV